LLRYLKKIFYNSVAELRVILLLYWLLVAEDMKPWLSAMVPSLTQQFIA
jgi:hypothetical protein